MARADGRRRRGEEGQVGGRARGDGGRERGGRRRRRPLSTLLARAPLGPAAAEAAEARHRFELEQDGGGAQLVASCLVFSIASNYGEILQQSR